MAKKHLVMPLLFALTLLSLALVSSSGQQGNSYDSWQDYNGDGVVDANDLQAFGQTYGSSGNPTKNVNVMNFPLDEQGNLRVTQMNSEQNLTVNLKQSHYQWCTRQQIEWFWTTDLVTAGYKQIFIAIDSSGVSATLSMEFLVSYEETTFTTWRGGIQTSSGAEAYQARTFDVAGTTLRISVWHYHEISINVTIGVYMTT